MGAKLIVGFGNPGQEYENSRHNLGFFAVDYLSSTLGIPYKFEKKKAIYGKKRLGKQEVIILKPQTFSNLSGEAVLYIASFLKVSLQDIFVIYDDIKKEIGSVRIEKNAEKIEHNAVHNLARALVSADFMKCGVGIGPKPRNMEPEDFYLSDFSEAERKLVDASLPKLKLLVEEFLELDKA